MGKRDVGQSRRTSASHRCAMAQDKFRKSKPSGLGCYGTLADCCPDLPSAEARDSRLIDRDSLLPSSPLPGSLTTYPLACQGQKGQTCFGHQKTKTLGNCCDFL